MPVPLLWILGKQPFLSPGSIEGRSKVLSRWGKTSPFLYEKNSCSCCMLILSKKKLHAGLSIIQSNEKIECNKQMKSTIIKKWNLRIVCAHPQNLHFTIKKWNLRIVCTQRPLVERFASLVRVRSESKLSCLSALGQQDKWRVRAAPRSASLRCGACLIGGSRAYARKESSATGFR